MTCLTLLASCLLVVAEAVGDWSWSNPPPEAVRIIVTNRTTSDNPNGNASATAYDTNGNVLRRDIFGRARPAETENPEEYTIVQGSDPDRQEKVEELCNNSCEIHISGSQMDMMGGDVTVIHTETGRKEIYVDPGDGEGYRCFIGCDEPTEEEQAQDEQAQDEQAQENHAEESSQQEPPPEENPAQRETISSTPEEDDQVEPPDGQCVPGGGLMCWTAGDQICRCGGGDDYQSKGAYKECENKSVCNDSPNNSMMHEKACGGDPESGWWIPFRTESFICLKPYDGPTDTPLGRAQAACGHLVRDRCSGNTCPSIRCKMGAITPLWDGDAYVGHCRTCAD